MTKRLGLLAIMLVMSATAARGQYVKILATAEQSGKIITSGVTSTTSASKTFPGSTVTVYSPSGSGTIASIFSTSTGTVKANPFTASLTDATIDFYIASGSTFDIRISGIIAGVAISAFTRSGYMAPGTTGISLALCGGTADTSLLAALSALGGTIQIPNSTTCASNTQTISAALQVDKGGLLKPLNSQTVTLSGPQIGGVWQRFTNATSGLGTVLVSSNVEAWPDWWGVNTTQGTTVTTTYTQAAFNSGAATIRIDNNYRVGAITIPTSVHLIHGIGTLTQNVAGANVLASNGGVSNLTIDGITIVGVSGDALESSNDGIAVSSASNVTVKNCTFQTLRYYVFEAISSSDVHFERNKIVGGSTGIQFSGVTDGWIDKNDFPAPQYTGFNVGIKLDTGPSTPNTNIHITRNKFQSWVYSQAVLVHNGNHVSISDNHMIDGLTGISLNPYCTAVGVPTGCTAADVVNDVTISPNIYLGTSTATAPASFQNSGVTISGASTAHVTNVTITGGIYQNANIIGDLFSQGGITVGYADTVSIIGVQLLGCKAAGIALNNPTTGLNIKGNTIKTVVAATDTSQNGIITTVMGPHTGTIEGNWIDGTGYGMRFGVSSPSLFIGPNYILNASIAAYRDLSNVAPLSNLAGTFAGGVYTAAQITGNQNDYNPGQIAYLQRWSTDASRNITGLSLSQTDGMIVVIVNVGSQDIVLKNQSASSAAANRFLNSTGADITLTANQQAVCPYDLTTARWRCAKSN